MKKSYVYFFVLICLTTLLLSLTGCSKTAGKLGVDGDTVKIQGSDGSEAIIGKTEWPDSGLVKKIPKFTKGNVISSVAAEDTAAIYLEKVKDKDFAAYLDEIKKTYTKDIYENEANGIVMYSASNENQITIVLQYDKENETMNLNASKKAQ